MNLTQNWQDVEPLVLLKPQWPAPAWVKAASTTRIGGVSEHHYASLNVGQHVGDLPSDVASNRAKLSEVLSLPAQPFWLDQVHGTQVIDLDYYEPAQGVQADASTTTQTNQVCVVMTADCLPVLFCDQSGERVAAAHAGWRGLCEGVLEQTLQHFSEPAKVMVWLGPAIGPQAFEVGAEVRDAFVRAHAPAAHAFIASTSEGKFYADLYLLARMRLMAAGVRQIYGGEHCTFNQPDYFFSYRRGSKTGRMASLIWLAPSVS